MRGAVIFSRPPRIGRLLVLSQIKTNYTALGEASYAATSQCAHASIAYGARRRAGDENSKRASAATGGKAWPMASAAGTAAPHVMAARGSPGPF
jgi:hypothetical protein